jgi:hypothetical protein
MARLPAPAPGASQLALPRLHDGGLLALAYVPQRRQLVSLAYDGCLRLYTTAGGGQLKACLPHPKGQMFTALLPCGPDSALVRAAQPPAAAEACRCCAGARACGAGLLAALRAGFSDLIATRLWQYRDAGIAIDL